MNDGPSGRERVGGAARRRRDKNTIADESRQRVAVDSYRDVREMW